MLHELLVALFVIALLAVLYVAADWYVKVHPQAFNHLEKK
jgi:hypothetical protein